KDASGKTVTTVKVLYKVWEEEIEGYFTTYKVNGDISPTAPVLEAVKDTATDVETRNFLDENDFTELHITKNWKEECVNPELVRPSKLTFLVEYSIDGGATWRPLQPGGRTPDVDTDGHISVDVTTKADQNTVDLFRLPTKAPDKTYEYRVSEYSILYGTTEVLFDTYKKANAYTGTWLTEYDETDKVWKATVENTVEKGTIEVQKTWKDEDNRTALRPESLTYELYRVKTAGETKDMLVDTAVVNTAPDFKKVWNNVPVKNPDGSDAQYYVVETKPEGSNLDKYTTTYTVSVNSGTPASYDTAKDSAKALTADTTNSVTVTNKYVPVRGRVDAKKIWEDYSNKYDLRPDQLYLTLKYQVEGTTTWTTVGEGTLNADNLYPDGGVYTTSVAVQKIEPKTQDNQTAAWENLPVTVYKDGEAKKVYYKVFETDAIGLDVNLPNYIEVSDTTDGEALEEANNYASQQNITNTLEETKLSLEKTWTDDLGSYSQDGTKKLAEIVRPVKIEFYVEYFDGTVYDPDDSGPASVEPVWKPLDTVDGVTAVDGIVTMTGDAQSGTWGPVTLENLPKYSVDGDVILYRAKEAKIYYSDGSTWIPQGDYYTDLYWVGYPGAYDADVLASYDTDTETWTVSAENVLWLDELTVSKTWRDAENRDGIRPTEITLDLHMVDNDGTAEYDTVIDTVTLTFTDDWTYTWNNLPQYSRFDKDAYMRYYVVESTPEGYETVYTFTAEGTESEETADPYDIKGYLDGGISSVTVINQHEPQKFEIEARKIWNDDENYYGFRPAEITLRLEATTDDPADPDAVWAPVEHVDSVPAPADDDGIKIYTTSEVEQILKAEDQTDPTTWVGAFWENLPVYISEGQTIYYRAAETEVPAGYVSEAISGEGHYIDEETDIILDVENTLDPTQLTVTKNFVPDIRASVAIEKYKALPDSITVQLQYFDEESGTWAAVPENSTAVLNKENDWTYTFEELNNAYEYRAIETRITYNVDDTPVDVPVDYSTDEENGTVGCFNYIAVTTGDAEEGFETAITNDMPRGELTVTKKWNDSNDCDGIRPESITVDLHRVDMIAGVTSDNVIDTVIMKAGGDGTWPSVTWSDLPMYTSDGSGLSKYYVEEDAEGVPEYIITYVGNGIEDADPRASMTDLLDEAAEMTIVNTHEPRLFVIEGTKTWEDNSNADGKRDKSVTLVLKYSKDGGDTWQTVEKLAVADRPAGGKGVWTSSEPAQTITGGATVNTWTGAIWKDLPGYVNVNDEPVEVLYKISEQPSGNTLYTAYETEPVSINKAVAGVAQSSILNKKTGTPPPKTGDTNNMSMWMMLMAAAILAMAGAGTTLFAGRKKNDR
ncbi:MAG: Cna B-type domain-containing protein, partial [Parasporobacterium sp.]|nr:Cna B-type domain-containing protein [Parasporobacterium sp.]